ncbi:hypothetical protein [Ralstonia mannitolilytica]|uniref:hypothetical protein n=1 Tax=Ralstonia mannitolilytica TaxID=105219 RepID=UPI00292E2AAA|nr:hypothetical protein [Ralstonia mannitolilytica]
MKRTAEETRKIESLYFMKHIDDYMLLFPEHEGTVKHTDLHRFRKALENDSELNYKLEIIKEVRSVCMENKLFPRLKKQSS